MRTRIALLSVLVLTLAGCSAAEAEFDSGEQSEAPESQGFTNRQTNDAWISESQVQLSDGRVVTCLKYDEGYGAGMSCDWNNATAPDAPSASDGGE